MHGFLIKNVLPSMQTLHVVQALLASRDGSSASLSSLGLAGGSHPNLASAGSLGLPRGGGGGRGGGGSPGRTPSSASLGSGAGMLGAGSQHLSASQLLAVQARIHVREVVSVSLDGLNSNG